MIIVVFPVFQANKALNHIDNFQVAQLVNFDNIRDNVRLAWWANF